MVYELPESGDRSEARGLLQGRLEAFLRASLATGPGQNLPKGADAPLWWGRWTFDPARTAGGRLFIREVGPSGFLFDLGVFNGAHQGQITAYARILSADMAYCRLPNGPDDPDGELVFRRRHGEGRRTIEIEEAASCSYYGGMRAHFGGLFTRDAEPWFDRGYLNELELARLYSLVGEGISAMRECTADIGEGENLENEPMRVVWGGVAGLYTEMESIVMADDAGRMWAAYIDGSLVRYFTNVPQYRRRLPKTIEAWREKFREKEVRYCEPVKTVPGLDYDEVVADLAQEPDAPIHGAGARAGRSTRLIGVIRAWLR